MTLEEIIMAWWRRADTETITDLANRIREAGYYLEAGEYIAERDRYREALEKIANPGVGPWQPIDIATEALRGTK